MADPNSIGQIAERTGQDLINKAKEIGGKFLQDNAASAAGLGEDLAESALTLALVDYGTIDVPPLSENPSVREIANREEQCLFLSRQADALAGVEEGRAEKVRELKLNAAGAAGQIAGQLGAGLLSGIMQGLFRK